MKNITLLLALIFLTFNASAWQPQVGDTLFVWVGSELNLRKAASGTSSIIATMPMGSQVLVLEQDSIRAPYQFQRCQFFNAAIKDTCLLLKGAWLKVRYLDKNLTGYAFDFYLSRWPAPEQQPKFGAGTFKEPLDLMKEYLEKTFKLKQSLNNTIVETDGEKTYTLDYIYGDIITFKHTGHGQMFEKADVDFSDWSFAEAYLLVSWAFSFEQGSHYVLGKQSPDYLLLQNENQSLIIQRTKTGAQFKFGSYD